MGHLRACARGAGSHEIFFCYYLLPCRPLGSLRSLFANAHAPANAGVVFNGCAVVCCGSFGSSGKHQEAGSVAASTVPSWEPGHRSPGDHQRQPPRVHSLATDEQARNADIEPNIVPKFGTQGHRRPTTGFLLSRLTSYPPATQRTREGPKIARPGLSRTSKQGKSKEKTPLTDAKGE